MSLDMVPLAPLPVQKVIKTILKGRAAVLETYDIAFHSGQFTIEVPKRVIVFVKAPKHLRGPARLTNYALKLRDRFTCQYCGRSELKKGEFLTRDHIIPQSRGGTDEWDNVVICCSTCNNKKDNRTPEEAHMQLLGNPYAPTRWQLDELARERENK